MCKLYVTVKLLRSCYCDIRYCAKFVKVRDESFALLLHNTAISVMRQGKESKASSMLEYIVSNVQVILFLSQFCLR